MIRSNLTFSIKSLLICIAMLQISLSVLSQAQTTQKANQVEFYYIITTSDKASFATLRDWAGNYFTKSPFLASIKSNKEDNSLDIKSKVMLILPPDTQKRQTRVMMHYRFQACLVGRECAIKYSDISYSFPDPINGKRIYKRMKAEELISPSALQKQDKMGAIKQQLLKSTLYFMEEDTNASLKKHL